MSQSTIWKFDLENKDRVLRVPRRTVKTPIHFGEDPGGTVCVWLEVVDPQPHENGDFVELPIYVYGTGHPFPTDRLQRHVGTVIDGSFVWHYYIGDA